MILSNTETVPGKTIREFYGVVTGSTVRAKHVGRDIMAGLKNIVGGELKGYTELLNEARTEALMDEELAVYRPDGRRAGPVDRWGPWVLFPAGSHTRTVIETALRPSEPTWRWSPTHTNPTCSRRWSASASAGPCCRSSRPRRVSGPFIASGCSRPVGS